MAKHLHYSELESHEVPVVPYTQHKKCPECADGFLVWQEKETIAWGEPIRIPHSCTSCGLKVTMEDKFPRIVHRELVQE